MRSWAGRDSNRVQWSVRGEAWASGCEAGTRIRRDREELTARRSKRVSVLTKCQVDEAGGQDSQMAIPKEQSREIVHESESAFKARKPEVSL